MRIAVVSDTYPPLRNSGAVQVRDLVRELANQGHETAVIIPGGQVDGPWIIERSDGATVLRCRTPATRDIGYLRRTLNEMRLPYILLRALRQTELRDQLWDGVIWYAPSIFLAPLVQFLRTQSGCPSYLILRDIFPEWAVDVGLMKRGLAYHLFKYFERRQYAVSDTIGVQSPANMPYIRKFLPAHRRAHVEVLQNWLSEASNVGCPIDIAATRLRGRKILVYAGNMGVAQGMADILQLAINMRDRQDVGFLFVGRGSDAANLAGKAQSAGLDNVLFYDEIDPAEIPGLLAQCHLGIVALDPRHSTHNIPGKFLTYMQAGIPVLARINPGNDLEKLIRDERVGRVCTGGGPVALQHLAEDLLSNEDELRTMQSRGRALAKRLFSSSAAVGQIVEALSRDRHSVPVARPA